MRIGPPISYSISRVMSSRLPDCREHDLTHDAGVVDQNVELGEIGVDLFVKSAIRFRIGNVARKV